MDKLEKVIKGITLCNTDGLADEMCPNCPYVNEANPICVRSLFNDALELLKEQQPRVLSYDEMKTMIGKPVYVEEPKRNADPQCYWGIVVEGEEPPKEGGYNYPGGVDFNVEVGLNVYDGDLYMVDIGCGWRAWTAEPTDEQRMNTPWEGR